VGAPVDLRGFQSLSFLKGRIWASKVDGYDNPWEHPAVVAIRGTDVDLGGPKIDSSFRVIHP